MRMWYALHLKGHLKKPHKKIVFEHKIRIENLACNVNAAYATLSD